MLLMTKSDTKRGRCCSRSVQHSPEPESEPQTDDRQHQVKEQHDPPSLPAAAIIAHTAAVYGENIAKKRGEGEGDSGSRDSRAECSRSLLCLSLTLSLSHCLCLILCSECVQFWTSQLESMIRVTAMKGSNQQRNGCTG